MTLTERINKIKKQQRQLKLIIDDRYFITDDQLQYIIDNNL